MVNYTVYLNWFNAYDKNKITHSQLEDINSLLQQINDEKRAEEIKKEMKDMEEKCPIEQMSKFVFQKYRSLLREQQTLMGHLLNFEYSTEVKPEFRNIFIPISSAEKLPIRSELYTKEFKCLTHSNVHPNNDWTVQYLSGFYHDKTKRLFVQTLGDSYQMNTLHFDFSFRRYFADKRKSSKLKK